MQHILSTDEEENWCYSNVFLQRKAEYTMEEIWEQRESLKKNGKQNILLESWLGKKAWKFGTFTRHSI